MPDGRKSCIIKYVQEQERVLVNIIMIFNMISRIFGVKTILLCMWAFPFTFILSLIFGVIAYKSGSLRSKRLGKAILFVLGIIVVMTLLLIVRNILFSPPLSDPGLSALDPVFTFGAMMTLFVFIQVVLLCVLLFTKLRRSSFSRKPDEGKRETERQGSLWWKERNTYRNTCETPRVSYDTREHHIIVTKRWKKGQYRRNESLYYLHSKSIANSHCCRILRL